MSRVDLVENGIYNEKWVLYIFNLGYFAFIFNWIVDCWRYVLLFGALSAHVGLRHINSKFYVSIVSFLFLHVQVLLGMLVVLF